MRGLASQSRLDLMPANTIMSSQHGAHESCCTTFTYATQHHYANAIPSSLHLALYQRPWLAQHIMQSLPTFRRRPYAVYIRHGTPKLLQAFA